MQHREDQKEKELELRKLRAKNQRQMLQSLDRTRYMMWGPSEICEWIIGLGSGRLVVYGNVLREKLVEEDVNGSLLGAVDSADLKGWGIVKLSDRKFLQQQISKLLNNNAIPINHIDDEGMNAASTVYH